MSYTSPNSSRMRRVKRLLKPSDSMRVISSYAAVFGLPVPSHTKLIWTTYSLSLFSTQKATGPVKLVAIGGGVLDFAAAAHEPNSAFNSFSFSLTWPPTTHKTALDGV